MQAVENESLDIIEFTENQQVLLKVLGGLTGIVIKKGANQFFSCVKIDVRQTEIEFTTTDAEISITKKIDCKNIVKSGSIAVDALKLAEIFRKMPTDKQIKIKSDGKKLQIACQSIKFFLSYLDAKDFCDIKEGKLQNCFSLHTKDFIYLLEKVKFAASKEVARQNLNGIYIEAKDQKITAAATDINRLAVAFVDLPIKDEFCFILSKKTINEALKLAALQDEVKIGLHGEQNITKVKFFTKEAFLVSKLVVGTFPAFYNVIPSSFKYSLMLDKKSIVGAIERVAIVSSDYSRAVKFKISQTQIEVSATDTSASFAKECIEIKKGTQEELEIHFNYTYLLEAFCTVDSQEIKMLFERPNFQVVFKDQENPNSTYVVMPMMG